MEKEIQEITHFLNQKIINHNFNKDDENYGLYEGYLGVVFYLSQIYSVANQVEIETKIGEILDFVIEKVSQSNNLISVSASFSQGMSGLGYVLMELNKKGVLDDDINDFLVGVDEFVLEEAIKEINNGNFDFMRGALGMLFYLTKRPNKNYSIIVDHLYALLETTKYPFYNKIDDPYNRGINFGIAHGLPGLLIVLLHILEKDSSNKSLKIINHCVDVILESKHSWVKNDKTIFYPYNFHYNSDNKIVHQRTNRLAWCSGDLAVSLSLYKAGTILNRKDLIKESNLLGLASSRRKSLEETGIHLPIFCHGTSGAACLYKRLFELSGNELYKKEYKYWVEQTIRLLKKEMNENKITDNFNILLGITGAVLTINDLKDQLGNWEHAFLI